MRSWDGYQGEGVSNRVLDSIPPCPLPGVRGYPGIASQSGRVVHPLGSPRHRTAVFVSFRQCPCDKPKDVVGQALQKPTVEKPVNSFSIFCKREPVPCSEPYLRFRGRDLGFGGPPGSRSRHLGIKSHGQTVDWMSPLPNNNLVSGDMSRQLDRMASVDPFQ